MKPSFNVIRLDRGPKQGQVHVIPVRESGRLRLRAQWLLCNVSYEAAYWYASGLLRGEGSKAGAHCYPGRSKYWKNYLSGTHWDIDEPSCGRTYSRGDREDFHADG